MPAIQGFSRFVRRTANPGRVVAFYEQGLGLPVLRQTSDSTVFWAGETLTYEVLAGAPREPARESHHEPLTPVFRVYDFDRVIARLDALSTHYVERREHEHSRVAYFHDPDGNLTGMQERLESSPRPEDVRSLARWRSGDTQVAGMPALAESVQHLGWILLVAADAHAVTRFYHDMLGMNVIEQAQDGGSRLAFGDDMMMIILTGGHRKAIPTDPMTAVDTWLARGRSVIRTATGWRKQGIHVIGDPIEHDGATHVYFADPEGNLFGIRETADGTRPEDAEALRRRL